MFRQDGKFCPDAEFITLHVPLQRGERDRNGNVNLKLTIKTYNLIEILIQWQDYNVFYKVHETVHGSNIAPIMHAYSYQ